MHNGNPFASWIEVYTMRSMLMLSLSLSVSLLPSLSLAGCMSQETSSTSTTITTMPAQPPTTCTTSNFVQSVRSKSASTAKGDYLHAGFSIAVVCSTQSGARLYVRMRCGDYVRENMAEDVESLLKLGGVASSVGVKAIGLNDRIVVWDNDTNCKIDLAAPSSVDIEGIARDIISVIP